MAVSTFCRTCGGHFGINSETRFDEKKKKAEENATHSSASLAGGWNNFFGKRSPSGETAFSVSSHQEASKKNTSDHYPQGSISSFLRQVSGKVNGPVSVRCFDCERVHKVPHGASSTLCPSCSSYISLEDIVVTEQQTREIRTRGNVIVKKGVAFIGGISCNNLKIYGKVLGKMDCTGELHFHSSGRTLGAVLASRLIVHKRCEITFVHDVTAMDVAIEGTAHGALICDGRLHIGKKGILYGDIATRSLSVDSGGSLSGQLRIINDKIPSPVASEQTTDHISSPVETEIRQEESTIKEAVPA